MVNYYAVAFSLRTPDFLCPGGFLQEVRSSGKQARHSVRSVCDSIEETPWISGFRAGIHHVMMPYDQEDGQHYSKLLIHEFLNHIIVWSSRTDIS